MFFLGKRAKLRIEDAYAVIAALGLSKKTSPEGFKTFLHKLTGNRDEWKSDDLRSELYEFIYKHKPAFTLDWKWEPEALLTAVKRLLPAFRYKLDVQDYDEAAKQWTISGRIGDQPVRNTVRFSHPEDLLNKMLNPVLAAKFGKRLVEYDLQSDSYGFVLVPEDKATEIKRFSCFL